MNSFSSMTVLPSSFKIQANKHTYTHTQHIPVQEQTHEKFSSSVEAACECKSLFPFWVNKQNVRFFLLMTYKQFFPQTLLQF